MSNNANKKPNPHDILYHLKDDEEYFVLAARDPLAPFLVMMWTAATNPDAEAGDEDIAELLPEMLRAAERRPADTNEKREEAWGCARKMLGLVQGQRRPWPRAGDRVGARAGAGRAGRRGRSRVPGLKKNPRKEA